VISPRLAVVARPYERGRSKLVVGQAYRAPSEYEQYYNDSGVTQIAAPPLDAEIIGTVEVEHTHELGRGSYLLVSLFASRIEKLIGLDTDDATGPAGLPNAADTLRGPRRRGEARFASRAGSWVSAAVSFHRSRRRRPAVARQLACRWRPRPRRSGPSPAPPPSPSSGLQLAAPRSRGRRHRADAARRMSPAVRSRRSSAGRRASSTRSTGATEVPVGDEFVQLAIQQDLRRSLRRPLLRVLIVARRTRGPAAARAARGALGAGTAGRRPPLATTAAARLRRRAVRPGRRPACCGIPACQAAAATAASAVDVCPVPEVRAPGPRASRVRGAAGVASWHGRRRWAAGAWLGSQKPCVGETGCGLVTEHHGLRALRGRRATDHGASAATTSPPTTLALAGQSRRARAARGCSAAAGARAGVGPCAGCVVAAAGARHRGGGTARPRSATGPIAIAAFLVAPPSPTRPAASADATGATAIFIGRRTYSMMGPVGACDRPWPCACGRDDAAARRAGRGAARGGRAGSGAHRRAPLVEASLSAGRGRGGGRPVQHQHRRGEGHRRHHAHRLAHAGRSVGGRGSRGPRLRLPRGDVACALPRIATCACACDAWVAARRRRHALLALEHRDLARRLVASLGELGGGALDRLDHVAVRLAGRRLDRHRLGDASGGARGASSEMTRVRAPSEARGSTTPPRGVRLAFGLGAGALEHRLERLGLAASARASAAERRSLSQRPQLRSLGRLLAEVARMTALRQVGARTYSSSASRRRRSATRRFSYSRARSRTASRSGGGSRDG
jgi:hypothetical protein